MHSSHLLINIRQTLRQIPHRFIPLLNNPKQIHNIINNAIIIQDLPTIKLLGKQPHIKQLGKPPRRPMGHLSRHQHVITRTL